MIEPPVIATEGLRKRYGRTEALKGLTMDVRRGEVFGFLGPNGAGKTTAVKLLLGLVRPSGGTGRVLGAPLGDRGMRRRIGYLPELFRYQAWLTGREVLGVHARLAGLDGPQRARVDEVIGTVDLASAADRRVGTYSKGMQQRLGLAVAILARPALVFLDEPTSALDPVGRVEVREVIQRLAHDGTTVFLNSHLLSEVEKVCDRVAIVDEGRVIQQGSLDELLSGGVVRVRVEGSTGEAMDAPTLGRFAPPEISDGWWVYPGLAHADVPDLVAALVGAGLHVFAVETRQQTLEDRFRELLDRS